MSVDYRTFLREYDGKPIRIMEVCGTHTRAIAHEGIRGLLSPKISLLSGPGCPVCVTVTQYIDTLITISKVPGTTVVTFGDMIRVPGSTQSLSEARADGAKVEMVYAPYDMIRLAKEHPSEKYVFAAVGFETTAAVYADLLGEIIASEITQITFLTSLKIMPPVLEFVCKTNSVIDGFLAPGHVAVITGSDVFTPLAEKYHLPFAVSGFSGEEILLAIYALVKMITRQEARVMNVYPSVVTPRGNISAQSEVDRYFEKTDAAWRGMGIIAESGLTFRGEYKRYDAGSFGLYEDVGTHLSCQCGLVITGKKSPEDCPLFGRLCVPERPQGACMVSSEGSCCSHYMNRGD